MFERFTERAREVIRFSQEEARNLACANIETGHLLLGLLREEKGVAARVLGDLGVRIADVRGRCEDGAGSPADPIPFTPGAKKVLELALREALSLGHNYIGTEHILIALVRENEGGAARILLDLDIDSEKVRNEVVRALMGAAKTRTVNLEPALVRFTGVNRRGIAVTGAFTCTPAALAERLYRERYRSAKITDSGGSEVGGVSRLADDGNRCWWGETDWRQPEWAELEDGES